MCGIAVYGYAICPLQFVPMPFNEYLEQLSRELWGGEIELVVISKLYARTVLVFMRNEQDGGIGKKTFGPAKSNNPVSCYTTCCMV